MRNTIQNQINEFNLNLNRTMTDRRKDIHQSRAQPILFSQSTNNQQNLKVRVKIGSPWETYSFGDLPLLGRTTKANSSHDGVNFEMPELVFLKYLAYYYTKTVTISEVLKSKVKAKRSNGSKLKFWRLK